MELNLASLDIYHIFYLTNLGKNAHLSGETAWVFCFSSLKFVLNKETCGTDAWETFHVSALIPLLCKLC